MVGSPIAERMVSGLKTVARRFHTFLTLQWKAELTRDGNKKSPQKLTFEAIVELLN